MPNAQSYKTVAIDNEYKVKLKLKDKQANLMAKLQLGDYVVALKAGKTYRGWVSGDTEKQVSVSDFDWKRLGRANRSLEMSINA
ncbi:hypothetical protein F7734_24000 [Scytonema sp. UIC 10036]|uniref:hypothetical protein n=1 Tax=Scytonema sp. UIC 10036 TaxID=2304196 RepID=UPI0012DAA60E|nr:hypothetical protein [Scytonema sp. UIC 10036]MUG95257.1 hypothetical protein [Scytonema sp. UIC 10036]